MAFFCRLFLVRLRAAFFSHFCPFFFTSKLVKDDFLALLLSKLPNGKGERFEETTNGSSFPTVLDLGAGCGLASIVFHSLGFNVIATDRLSIVNLLEENVNNYLATGKGLREPFVKIIPFDWELENDFSKFTDKIDLILCSDCLYNSAVVEPLIRVIHLVSFLSSFLF
jgi:predicted TPR repeat methyltransferase